MIDTPSDFHLMNIDSMTDDKIKRTLKRLRAARTKLSETIKLAREFIEKLKTERTAIDRGIATVQAEQKRRKRRATLKAIEGGKR